MGLSPFLMWRNLLNVKIFSLWKYAEIFLVSDNLLLSIFPVLMSSTHFIKKKMYILRTCYVSGFVLGNIQNKQKNPYLRGSHVLDRNWIFCSDPILFSSPISIFLRFFSSFWKTPQLHLPNHLLKFLLLLQYFQFPRVLYYFMSPYPYLSLWGRF